MPTDPRVTVNFRVAEKQRDWLDDLATAHKTERATVLRAALRVARAHSDELAIAVAEMAGF